MGPKANSVRAKRRTMSQASIAAKIERGDANGEERVLVRMGKANTAVLMGTDDLSDWTDEELRYGRRLGKGGRFIGRPPKVVPKALHDELVRRTLASAQNLMRDNLEDAVEQLCIIARSPAVEAKDRLRAISMIMDRVMGKSPEKVEISGQSPWLVALQAGVVNVNGDGTVEAEAVEEDIEDADWEES